MFNTSSEKLRTCWKIWIFLVYTVTMGEGHWLICNQMIEMSNRIRQIAATSGFIHRGLGGCDNINKDHGGNFRENCKCVHWHKRLSSFETSRRRLLTLGWSKEAIFCWLRRLAARRISYFSRHALWWLLEPRFENCLTQNGHLIGIDRLRDMALQVEASAKYLHPRMIPMGAVKNFQNRSTTWYIPFELSRCEGPQSLNLTYLSRQQIVKCSG